MNYNQMLAKKNEINDLIGYIRKESVDIDGIILTKLDGTAKGGVVIGISDQFQIPVKYVGLGEGMDDLQVFSKREFVDSLFNN